jgi:hypothetical protein
MEERVGERFIELDASRRVEAADCEHDAASRDHERDFGRRTPQVDEDLVDALVQALHIATIPPPRNASLVWSRDLFAQLDLR